MKLRYDSVAIFIGLPLGLALIEEKHQGFGIFLIIHGALLMIKRFALWAHED